MPSWEDERFEGTKPEELRRLLEWYGGKNNPYGPMKAEEWLFLAIFIASMVLFALW